MIELKPCPFCGGEARLYKGDGISFNMDIRDCFIVHLCNSGGSLFTMIRTDNFRTPREAADAWNTREVMPNECQAEGEAAEERK